MSKKNSNSRFGLMLLSIVLCFVMLLGACGNLNGLFDGLRSELDETDVDTTERQDPVVNNSHTTYLGDNDLEISTYPYSTTEGFIVFCFESVFESATQYTISWAIDSDFAENTVCSFYQLDYNGVYMYNVDYCFDYTGSTADTYYPIYSTPDLSVLYRTAGSSAVTNGKGNTFGLRLLRYKLVDGMTTSDVIESIIPYIQWLTFSTSGTKYINNPNYHNFSGELIPPETEAPVTEVPETEAPGTTSPGTDDSGSGGSSTPDVKDDLSNMKISSISAELDESGFGYNGICIDGLEKGSYNISFSIDTSKMSKYIASYILQDDADNVVLWQTGYDDFSNNNLGYEYIGNSYAGETIVLSFDIDFVGDNFVVFILKAPCSNSDMLFVECYSDITVTKISD